MKKAVVFLAEGFEEIEAVVPIDILRRGGVEVTVAGVGGDVVAGSHGIVIETDCIADEINPSDYDGVVLPGGIPGANNLADSGAVDKVLEAMRKEGRLIAAICASPAVVLSSKGYLDGKSVTGYPGVRFESFGSISYLEEDVVSDGNFITSKGPGTAFPFALKILEYLQGKDTADRIAEAALYSDK